MKKVFIKTVTIILSVLILLIPALAVKEGVSYGDVPKWNEAIAIDGVKDEAYDYALKIHQSRKHYENEPDTPTNGDAYILWSDGFIHVYAEITDSTLVPVTEDIQSNQPWMSDSEEVFLDVGNDGVDPMQYRIDYMGRPSFQFADSNSYGQDASACKDILEYAATKTDKGYCVEFKIPFATAKTGEQIGLQLQINDMQDETNRTCVMPSSSLTAGSWDSNLYDYIVLADAPIIVTEAPVDDTPDAPQTGDIGIMLYAVLLSATAVLSVGLIKIRSRR